MQRSLSEWLVWQATLNPHDIELGLERVSRVVDRLSLERPSTGSVCRWRIEWKRVDRRILSNSYARRTGCVPQPTRHRTSSDTTNVCVLTVSEVSDEWLVEQFETVDAARGETPLTYFEFGTLAALQGFSQARVDAWILEVGLGGRLDAVNVIDPDISVVTTVALEHQEWLGETIDAIAAEKAGILRRDRPAFYGDEPMPDGFRRAAKEIGAHVSSYGVDFGYTEDEGGTWTWHGASMFLAGLAQSPMSDPAQLRNVSLGLAAVEACDSGLLNRSAVERALAAPRSAGKISDHRSGSAMDCRCCA